MVSQLNQGTPARDAGYEMTQYISGHIIATSAGAAVNVKIGTIPAGSLITQFISRVSTAITGGAAQTLALGTRSNSGSELQVALSEAVGQEVVFPTSTIAMPLASDTDVWANISSGATAGDAYIVAQFIKPVS